MASIDELAHWLDSMDDIAVVSHVQPDGDALGSALALTLALRKLGKRAQAVCDDPAPRMYAFLPGLEAKEKPLALAFEPMCAVYVDVAARERAGNWQALMDRIPSAVLDHHGTNPGFCPISVVDARAGATGELVLTLIDALGVALDEAIATCLYAAISTDTGNFSFSNTSPGSLRAVARLIEAGLNLSANNRLLFRLRSLGRTKLLGLALCAMRFFYDDRIAVVELTADMYREAGAVPADNEGIVSYLNEIEGVEAAVLLEQRAAGTKLSLRSNGDVDVAALAKAFGGGGHARAAGATVNMPAQQALDEVLKALVSAFERA